MEATSIFDEDADHGAAVSGMGYKEFLAAVHGSLKPRTYFEIGTFSGESLALATCTSVAVDPQFRLSVDVVGRKPACLLFQQSSDDFFRDHNPSAIVGAQIDLAFLDGMHLAEFLLRDFINTEKHCRPDSIVVMHDCLPPGYRMTTRDIRDPVLKLPSKFQYYWTGDVWQVVPVLQRFRPDLSITITDCPPTGLVVITRLNPASTVLSDAYAEITSDHFPRLCGRAAYDDYWRGVRIEPSTRLLAALAQSRAADRAGRRLAVAPVQRNAPCPCGSGKKYKHCHGRLE